MSKKKTQGRTYYLFSQDHDVQDALARYAQRFGAQPEEHFVEKRALWLGPVSRPQVAQRESKRRSSH